MYHVRCSCERTCELLRGTPVERPPSQTPSCSPCGPTYSLASTASCFCVCVSGIVCGLRVVAVGAVARLCMIVSVWVWHLLPQLLTECRASPLVWWRGGTCVSTGIHPHAQPQQGRVAGPCGLLQELQRVLLPEVEAFCPPHFRTSQSCGATRVAVVAAVVVLAVAVGGAAVACVGMVTLVPYG